MLEVSRPPLDKNGGEPFGLLPNMVLNFLKMVKLVNQAIKTGGPGLPGYCNKIKYIYTSRIPITISLLY